MDLQQQQRYVTLAFVYGDNRQFVDLLDPPMFGEYGAIIDVIKRNQTMDDIWKEGMEK